jgi:hypothetical protein
MNEQFCERCKRRVAPDGPNAIVRAVIPFDSPNDDDSRDAPVEFLYFHRDCSLPE